MMNNLFLALVAVLVNLVLSVVMLQLIETRSVSVEGLKATYHANKKALVVSAVFTGLIVLMALKSFPPVPAASFNQLKDNFSRALHNKH